MSFELAISRIDQIVTAQQQLASAMSPAAASAATGATSQTTGTNGTTGTSPASFADALASAQAGATQAATPTAGAQATTATAGPAPNTLVPQTAWNPEHKPIASWIVPVLQWASQHGWTGSVTSGYRSFDQQAAINASGAYSAPAGRSNHETATYPGGAVDVTQPGQLMQVLRGYTGPQKLVGGVLGAVDPEHFSATGR